MIETDGSRLAGWDDHDPIAPPKRAPRPEAPGPPERPEPEPGQAAIDCLGRLVGFVRSCPSPDTVTLERPDADGLELEYETRSRRGLTFHAGVPWPSAMESMRRRILRRKR